MPHTLTAGGINLVAVLMFTSMHLAQLASAADSPAGNASDPGAELVRRYYESRRGSGREVPDTLDLQDNALLAIHAITAGMDPQLEYRVWFSIYFDRRPMTMRHHELSEFDQAGKYLEGLTLMRLMTGSKLNLDREAKLWEFIENHTRGDGLIYYRQTDSEPVYTYTQARALLARICRYTLDPNPEMKAKIERTIESMVARRMTRGFGFGPLLPAVRWHELTGSPKALELAELDFEALGRGGALNDGPDGMFQGAFHLRTGMAIGLLAYGLMKNDRPLIEKVRKTYEFARSQGTNYGYFPEAASVPPLEQWEYDRWVVLISNEGCCTADMTSLAAVLCRSGVGDYWDDLDRYLRNQLTEMQLKRTDFMDRVPKENQVAMPIDPAREEAEVDDWTRFIGSFAGWAAPNDFAGPAHFWLQQCCLGNCPRGLYQGWENIVTRSKDGWRVNLLLNRSTPELDVDSFLPHEGKVEIHVKADSKLEVRIPGWVTMDKVNVSIGDKSLDPSFEGRYLQLAEVPSGSTVTIMFPVTEREVRYRVMGTAPWSSKYSIVDEQAGSGMPLPRSVAATPKEIVDKILEPVEYRARFRGNTIVGIEPNGDIYPLYCRDYLRKSPVPRARVQRHIPNHVLENWN